VLCPLCPPTRRYSQSFDASNQQTLYTNGTEKTVNYTSDFKGFTTTLTVALPPLAQGPFGGCLRHASLALVVPCLLRSRWPALSGRLLFTSVPFIGQGCCCSASACIPGRHG
jgi:hypothetical protein